MKRKRKTAARQARILIMLGNALVAVTAVLVLVSCGGAALHDDIVKMVEAYNNPQDDAGIGEEAGIVAVTGVALDKGSLTVPISSSEQLNATVEPADATDQSVTWSSDNESVATVDANGLVTGVADGTASVTVTTTDGEFSESCDVTVSTPLSRKLVKAFQKISDNEGGFTGDLDNNDYFGSSVISPGDLDGDGVSDLFVGAKTDDDGGVSRGAVYVLFLNTDGTVKAHQKISDTRGNFTGTLVNLEHFGQSVTSLGDIDGDGIYDIAVGAVGDDDGGFDRGAIWVLFLNTDGTVKDHQKISDTEGGFTGIFDDQDYFGSSMCLIADLDVNGVIDLCVGARGDDGAGSHRGAVWVLFLDDAN